jgi:hypothetical protein
MKCQSPCRLIRTDRKDFTHILGSALAAQDDGEVGRKDALVIGDDGGLVLRIGFGEEPGHAADGLNHYVSAQEGTLFGKSRILGAEGIGDGETECAATGRIAPEAYRSCL